jgi:hypothetical protein
MRSMITIKLILNLHIRAIRSGPGGPTENYWPNSVGPVQQFSWDRIVSVGPVLDHFFGLGPNLGPRLGPNSRAAWPDARPARPEPSLEGSVVELSEIGDDEVIHLAEELMSFISRRIQIGDTVSDMQ